MNLYGFCRNDSINGYDVLGMGPTQSASTYPDLSHLPLWERIMIENAINTYSHNPSGYQLNEGDDDNGWVTDGDWDPNGNGNPTNPLSNQIFNSVNTAGSTTGLLSGWLNGTSSIADSVANGVQQAFDAFGSVQHLSDGSVIDENGVHWSWIDQATANGSSGDWYAMGNQDPSGYNESSNNTMGGSTLGTLNNATGLYYQKINWNVPAHFNGLLIQQVTAHYSVLNAKGAFVVSADGRINGAMSYSYYEAWQVIDGQVGVTMDGVFYPNSSDTFILPEWPSNVAYGTITLTAQAQLISGAAITNINWYQDTNINPTSVSGNLPIWNSIGSPPGWSANPNTGVMRSVVLNYNSGTSQWQLINATATGQW